MLNVTIVERARSTNLVTLAKLKQSLGIGTTDADERLSELIADVSSAIVAYCGKHFARTIVTEKLEGYGDTTLSLARTPVVRVSEVRFRTEAVDAESYSVSDKEAGFLYRENGEVFSSTQPIGQFITAQRLNMKGAQDWQVDYLGGYLMPDDDFVASGTARADASDNTFNLDDESDKWPLLASGESVRFSGFSNDENNGTFTIVGRTARKLYVTDTLVNESGAVVAVRTNLPENEDVMPRDLQRIALSEIRDRYMSEQRDGAVQSEKIGDWSVSYGSSSRSGSQGESENTHGFSKTTIHALQRYIRVM